MTIPRLALLALVALSSAACASAPVTGRPPIPPGVPEEFLHFSDATVARGQIAPDFTLPTPVGEGTITLSSLRGKPVVLVFASHT
jgi:AhpC/TSA family